VNTHAVHALAGHVYAVQSHVIHIHVVYTHVMHTYAVHDYVMQEEKCTKLIGSLKKKIDNLAHETFYNISGCAQKGIPFCSRHGFLHQRMNTNGTGTK
jgi:hypothetical protein